MPPSKRMPRQNPEIQYSYDVCLSFAGEDRAYVREVAGHLKAAGVKVFFDEFEKTTLWGIDLYEHLDLIYSKLSRYCVIFCSKHYAKKLWTSHERKSAQARAFAENETYLLPVKFDDTEIPGIRKTIGYLDLRDLDPTELANHIVKKARPWERMTEHFLAYQRRKRYYPSETDRLSERVKADNPTAQHAIKHISYQFYTSLSQLTARERFLILCIFMFGCAHDLPTNIHISIDMLCRIAKCKEPSVRKHLANVRSVGFNVTFPRKTARRRDDNIYTEWHLWDGYLAKVKQFETSNFTGICVGILHTATELFCGTHSVRQLMNLNFSGLSKEYHQTADAAFCQHQTQPTSSGISSA